MHPPEKSGKSAKSGKIRAGIGGWTFEPWRGVFYPDDLAQAKELSYASRHLPVIEVNGTYYSTQKPQTFARWAAETPDDFIFTLKGPRYATNRRELAGAGDSIARFLESGITELGEFSRLLVKALSEAPELKVPVVARLVGNGLPAARDVLGTAGIAVYPDLDDALAEVRKHLSKAGGAK